MTPRIAIPLPTSFDLAYNRLNWPAFAEAVRSHGGEPVEFALDQSPRSTAELANSCHAILLPGSPADVKPEKYGQRTEEGTAPADPLRENVDELLLQDAHNLYKPIFGVCFGAQMLNVWRSGTLLQHLTPLPVNHRGSRAIGVAHTVAVAPGSLLASVVDHTETEEHAGYLRLPVNSSHHQAIGIAGGGLTVSGRCPQDGVVEAIEGGRSPAGDGGDDARKTHFVLGVQWHPERTLSLSSTSRLLFGRFVNEAAQWTPRIIRTSVAR